MSDVVDTQDTQAAPEVQTTEEAPKLSRLEKAHQAISKANGTPAVAPPEVPAKPAPGASDEDANAYAKALAVAEAKQREAYQAKQEAKAHAAELQKLREAQEEAKKKPILDVLKDYGTSYEQLTKDIIDGKFKDLTPEQQALEGTKAEVAAVKAELEALRKEKEDAAAKQQRAKERDYVAAQIKSAAENHPMVAALEWVPDQAVKMWHDARAKGQDVELSAIITHLETAASKDVKAVLASDTALKALLADETFATRVASLLGNTATKQTNQLTQQAVKGANDSKPKAGVISQQRAAEGSRNVHKNNSSAARRQAFNDALNKR